ncbi:SRPBCC family protein [Halonotius terrestris]|uniref:SRPBCC family protein n=1 Tax=Halonotius terrestris TaxID=2487750 RepID=A0A8J8TCS8_9EURY|nr:SRPBCC family protein [Halonotius terrestris]TQQ81324.1 SRPBCC family protein [Halonotius terrestris]
MVTVADDIEIDASPEAVFEYLDEPTNHRRITPAISEVSNVEPLDNGGKELDFTYRLVAVPVSGHLVQTVHDPPNQHRFEMSGGLSGELGFEIEAVDGGSRVTYSAEYAIPGHVISRVIEPFVRRYNESELESTLANLKAELEGE